MDTGTLHWRLFVRNLTWRPPTDVYETDDEIIVRVEVAGMREDDFKIQVAGRTLLILGTRPDNAERRAFRQMEINFGEFVSQVELPASIDVNQVKADYDNGFLWVTLPKVHPRKIQIEE